MATMEAYPQLLNALDDLRRQWRSRKLLEGFLLVLAGVGVVLALLIAADNILQPEPLGRMLLALILWGALGVGVLGWIVRRWLEDRRDDFFAALVEQKHPELQNQLINALQLGRGSQNGFSPRLIEAIVNDAANATADMEMTSSLDGQPVRRALGWALGAVVLIAAYAVFLTPRFVNGFQRVLRPLAEIPAYTNTQVVDDSIKPGNKTVPEGAAVLIEARVTGTIPATAHLMRKTADGHWQPFVMQPESLGSDTFRFNVLQANESFDYCVAAGDGRSSRPDYHLEVVKRPQLERFMLSFTPPPYTGLQPRPAFESDGEFAGIAGTTVAVELTSSKALQQAAFELEGGEKVSLEKAADDRTWQTSMVISSRTGKVGLLPSGRIVPAPTRYRIRLTDTDGYDNADPLWHTIALTRDQPPTVTITTPGRDLQVKPDAIVDLAVDAKDDFGIGAVKIMYRLNEEMKVHQLTRFAHDGEPKLQTTDTFKWEMASRGLKGGDMVQYWAIATDRNDVTGPGQTESRRFTLFLLAPDQAVAKLDLRIDDYAQALEELLRLQNLNMRQTESRLPFAGLVERQTMIRTNTRKLARLMEKDALPVTTIVKSLDDLVAGLMVEAVKLLERGKELTDPAKADPVRQEAIVVQKKIIKELEALLARLQRNEQAKAALRKLEKKDKKQHQEITAALSQMIKDLDQLLKDKTELAAKFEKLPKRTGDEAKEERMNGAKELEEFQKKWEKWAKGKVNEMTKLPQGFIDDFGVRKEANKIFEEIEKAAQRPKAEKMEVSLEDLGAGLATKMKEDLETWLPDTPDAAKWVLEEPLDKKPMKIPEMPLPKELEDLVGDLLQKAEEFDEEADDVTSAWGDNLDQAGWGTSDGPISTFSAKGKTGNDLPNNMELNGRSGEGRRGKSSGQMVGDKVKGMQGRQTPARVGNERYEPGQLKDEGQQDPAGATGGGKKAGTGRKGLQGGTPPDPVKDIGRLSEKQAGLREKAEQIANKMDNLGISSSRLKQTIELMRSAEKDMRDMRYEDGARKRRLALNKLRSTLDVDQSTAQQLQRARDLPPQLRTELLRAVDEGYPPGYESLLKSYFKALSTAEK
jgi:hypothetical protein